MYDFETEIQHDFVSAHLNIGLSDTYLGRTLVITAVLHFHRKLQTV